MKNIQVKFHDSGLREIMSLSKVYDKAGELVQVVNKFHLFTDVSDIFLRIVDIPPLSWTCGTPRRTT